MATGKMKENDASSARKRKVKPAGKLAGKQSASLPIPAKAMRLPLRTVEHCRCECARVYRAMRSGQIPMADGSRLAFVLTTLARLIESGALETRLQEAERQLIALSRRLEANQ